MVCVSCIATAQTGEFGLRTAVAFIDMATTRACTAGIAGIDKTARYTGPLRFVHNKVRQLPKAPTLVLIALAFANRGPIANALQLFQGKGSLRVLRTRNKVFGNAVVHPSAKTGFFPT